MDGGSVESALERIDAAIARIEKAIQRPEPEEEALHIRHERLKAAVSQSLAQLDELIASQRR